MPVATPTGPLQRKLKKAIEPQSDSPDVLDALHELSAFYEDNTVQARRGLRSSIESRGLVINRKLLAAFEGLQNQLDSVDAEVESLCEACGSISSRLQDARASTEVLLAQTARLRSEATLNEQRSNLATAFTKTFGLTPEQEVVLNAPVDGDTQVEPLLEALWRVQEAHERAQSLLDGPHQALALQVIATMAAHEERAYASIYRWVQSHCAQLQVENAESVARLRRGVASLRQRPTLLSYCVREVATCRRAALHQQLVRVLSTAGTGRSDAEAGLHWLNDCMKELRRQVSLEQQLLDTLFVSETPAAAAAAAAGGGGGGGGTAAAEIEPAVLADALNVAFEQVAAPLELRLRRLLNSTLALPVGYKVALCLLRHTHALATTFSATGAALPTAPPAEAAAAPASTAAAPAAAAPEAEAAAAAAAAGTGGGGEHVLVSALRECTQLAFGRFESGLDAHLAPLLKTPPRPPADLSPPRALLEPLALLEELMETQRAAEAEAHAHAAGEAHATGGGGGGGGGGSDAAREQLLEVGARALRQLVPPLLQTCSEAAQLHLQSSAPAPPTGLGGLLGGGGGGGGGGGAAALGKLSVGERSIFLLNCIDAISQALSTHAAEVAAEQAAELDAHAEQMLTALAQTTALDFFERCGLQTKLAALQTAADQPQLALSSVVGLESLAMESAMRGFYSLLFKTAGALIQRAERVASLPLRRRALQLTAQTVAATHRHIHGVVSRDGSGYSDLSKILLHTPEEVETLLDVVAPS